MNPFYGSFSQPPQQNSMPNQPQLGMNNPQIPIPFGNSNGYLNNSMANQPGFVGTPNNLLLLQNNHMGMPQMGNVGFGQQNGVNSMNLGFPGRGQFGNLGQIANQASSSQFPGQPFGSNVSNLSLLNQNVGLPFGQFGLPNVLQNMNQFVPMQMPNPSQFGPQNAFGGLNQPPQANIPQNPIFLSNQQFGNGHSNKGGQQFNQNQHSLLQQGILSTPKIAPSVQTQQARNLGPQGNPIQNGGANISSSNWKNPSNKNFTRNPKRGMQHGGRNSQFHHMKNGKKNFGFPNGHNGRGPNNDREGNFGITSSMNHGREQNRSLSLTYTEQEVQQWREERKKNYPSKVNIEKKQNKKLRDMESFERETQARRERLQEILAKQAELGVEVAEIPGCSLSDLKQQERGRREKGRQFNKRGRQQNKFERRGKHDKRDWNSKKPRLHDNVSPYVPPVHKKEPTLLQKLLSADIKRDKSRLLQVFRFMVTNSFFKDWPNEPLKFPSVIVKEGCGDEVVEELLTKMAKDNSEVNDMTMVEDESVDSDDNDNDDKNDDNNGKDSKREEDEEAGEEGEEEEAGEEGEEEEGEIIN